MIKFDDGFYNVKLDFILSLSGKDILEKLEEEKKEYFKLFFINININQIFN